MSDSVELCVFCENIDRVDFSDLSRLKCLKKPMSARVCDEIMNEMLPSLSNLPCFANSKKTPCLGLELFGVFIIPNKFVYLLKNALKKRYSRDTRAAFRLCIIAEELQKDIVFFGV